MQILSTGVEGRHLYGLYVCERAYIFAVFYNYFPHFSRDRLNRREEDGQEKRPPIHPRCVRSSLCQANIQVVYLSSLLLKVTARVKTKKEKGKVKTKKGNNEFVLSNFTDSEPGTSFLWNVSNMATPDMGQDL